MKKPSAKCKELQKNLEASQALNEHLLRHVFRLQARVDELEDLEKARQYQGPG